MNIIKAILFVTLSLNFLQVSAQVIDKIKYYKGHSHSVIDWPNVVENDFLDLTLWKKEIKYKETHPNWKSDKRDLQISERVGIVIDCVGLCHLYRGLEFNKLGHLSTIREGDEIKTFEESYLWIYLMDGTLVRMAPDSSMATNEINLGTDANFLHMRFNYGNIYWLSRLSHKLKVQTIKETDALFLPAKMLKANPPMKFKDPTRDLFLGESTFEQEKYERLNKLIEENNKLVNKPTYSFLVMPNGTVHGKNLTAEFVLLKRSNSYVKVREPKQLGYENAEKVEVDPVSFYFRGYNNTQVKSLDPGTWYQVGELGRTIQTAKDKEVEFALGEFPTRHIPTILTARELMLRDISSFVFKPLSRRALSERHGFRLWTSMEKGELAKRVSFLKEYTRRIETTNLVVSEDFKLKAEAQGFKWDSAVYSKKYFDKAMQAYFKLQSEPVYFIKKGLILNSQKKPFWNHIHGRY